MAPSSDDEARRAQRRKKFEHIVDSAQSRHDPNWWPGDPELGERSSYDFDVFKEIGDKLRALEDGEQQPHTPLNVEQRLQELEYWRRWYYGMGPYRMVLVVTIFVLAIVILVQGLQLHGLSDRVTELEQSTHEQR